MARMTLQALSKEMANIDFAMLSTRTGKGDIASRPMSNNGDVEYTGDSFLFATESAGMIEDIENDAHVGLTFSGPKGLLGGPPLFIAVQGTAELIREREAFAAHWRKDLDRWFKGGVDTPGLVLIKVHADRIHYWDGTDEVEVPLQ